MFITEASDNNAETASSRCLEKLEQTLVQVFLEISSPNLTPECPINITFGV